MTQNEAQSLFTRLVGQWVGTSKIWFEPGKLGSSSPIQGSFVRIIDGKFLRHAYSSAVDGEQQVGDETIMFNPVTNQCEISWIDSFHMNYGIMFSVGSLDENGFTVLGSYDVEPNTPPWGWRTVYQMMDDNHLKISSFNVSPDGKEDLAVEIDYTRKNS